MFNLKEINNLRKINPGDRLYTYHTYLVTFSPLIKPSVVYANSAQSAVDIYADWAKVSAPGLLLEHDDPDLEDWHDDDIMYVGNESWPVLKHDVMIERVN